jgi:hypothetical protein
MEMNVEQLELCNSIRRTISELATSVRDMGKPMLTDIALIEPTHQAIQEELKGKSHSTIVRVELMVLLYLFNPMLIVSRKHEKNGAFREIARVMGVEISNLSKYKTTLLWHYKTYRDFRELTNATFEKIVENILE